MGNKRFHRRTKMIRRRLRPAVTSAAARKWPTDSPFAARASTIREMKPNLGPCTVGAAAKAVGASPKAIRIWEAKGLLPPAARTEAGYRLFSDDDITILRFILRAKTLGLTLPEIKDILDLHRQGTAPCDQVTILLEQRIGDIDRAIADLQALRATLAAARQTARSDRRRGHTATFCRIIESTDDTTAPPDAGEQR